VPSADISLEGGGKGYARLLATGGAPVGSGGIRMDLNLTRTDGWRDGSGYDRQSGTLRWDHMGGGGLTARTVITGSRVDQHDVYTIGQADYDARSTLNRSPITFRDVKALRASTALDWERGASLVSITPYARYDVLRLIPYWQLSYDPQLWDTRNTSVGVLAKYRRDFTPMRARVIAGFDADYSPGAFTADAVVTTPQGSQRIWSSYTTGARQYDYDVTWRSLSPYLHGELSPFPRLRIDGGLRLDLSDYDYHTNLPATDSTERFHKRPPSTTVSYTHLSPKVGATFQILPSLGAFASYRHGFRAPSQGQLFQQGSAASTVDLAPVKVDSYETGLRGEHAGRFVWQLSAYDMTIRDDILTYITPENQRVATNAGKTRHRGVEVSAGAALTTELRLDASYSLSRQRYVRWAPSASVQYDGKRIEQAPRDLANVQLSYAPRLLRGGRVAAEWAHTGSYAMDPANTRWYGGHNLLNLHASVVASQNVELFGRLINVTNQRYAELASYDAVQQSQYTPGAPRMVYMGVRYDWRRD
jgi:outer membrane receptor protein involved in Fe transport